MVFLMYTPGGPGLFWFIGLIVVLYLLFPVTIYFTEICESPFRNSLIMIAALILAGLMILSYQYDLFPTAQLYYYWLAFIMGIYAGYIGFTFQLTKRAKVKMTIAISITIVISYIIFNMNMPMFQPLIDFLPQQFSSNIWSILIMIIALNISFPTARLIKKRSGDLRAKWMTEVARSTNAIYLLHLYFLYLVMYAVLNLAPQYVGIIIIFVGVPAALILPPYVQDGVNMVISLLTRTLDKKHHEPPDLRLG